MLNALLGRDASKLSEEEKEQRSNQIQSLVAGIAHAAGVNGAVAVFAAENETVNNMLTVEEGQARLMELEQSQDDASKKSIDQKYGQISAERRREVLECEPGICVQKAEEITQRLSAYAERRGELEEKFRGPDGLSSLETKEYIDLIATVGLMLGDRATAIKRAMEGGGSDAKKVAWDSIGKAGVAGAATAVGAVGGASGKKSSSNQVKSKGSPIPVLEATIATNGLVYKSNPKHTPGQAGNRPNAGVEPKNSMSLFGTSIPSSVEAKQRYAMDGSGDVHKFLYGNDGTWH